MISRVELRALEREAKMLAREGETERAIEVVLMVWRR